MTTKTVYLFDQLTGEFKGAYDAQESPLEPGDFITPICSTTVAPPAFDLAASTCRFDGAGWVVTDLPSDPPSDPPEPPVPTAPTSVTMRQARLALLYAGLIDTVELAMAQQPRAAQIDWEFASTVERSSTLVAGMAQALSLTDAQLDALFVAAAAL